MKFLEDKRFYVYACLNTLKRGVFKYGEYKFEYEPFYIGKGYGDRAYCHDKEAVEWIDKKIDPNKCNPFKIRLILKLLDYEGGFPIVKLKQNLIEDRAFQLEKEIINIIGRKINSTGPLTNIDPGGLGRRKPQSISDKIPSMKGRIFVCNKEKTIQKCIKSNELNSYLDDGWIRGKVGMSEEQRKLNKIRQKEVQNRKDVKQKKSKAMKELWGSEKGKEIIKKRKRIKNLSQINSEKMKKYFSDPKNREKNRLAQRQVYIDQPNLREKKSKVMKELYSSEKGKEIIKKRRMNEKFKY